MHVKTSTLVILFGQGYGAKKVTKICFYVCGKEHVGVCLWHTFWCLCFKFTEKVDWKSCTFHVSCRNSFLCGIPCYISKELESHENDLKICRPVHISACDKYIQKDEKLSAKIFQILFSIPLCVCVSACACVRACVWVHACVCVRETGWYFWEEIGEIN